MSCLHIINKHQERLLEDCLRSMSTNDSLLLIEDAVYFSLNPTAFTTLKHNIYALAPDCEARGLQPSSTSPITCCSDEHFVELICQHEKSLSWY